MQHLILALIMVFGLIPGLPGQNSPKIEVVSTQWNFGEVDQGYQGEFKTEVYNRGDALLQVGRVGVTCGCITASIDQDLIKPGQKAVVTVKLDATRQVGALAKSVFLDTNDPKNKQVLIGVTGVIKTVWWNTHANLNFGMVDHGQSAKQKFRIMIAPNRRVEITNITSSSGYLSIEKIPFGTPETEHGFDVLITLKDDHPVGRMQGRITVFSDFPLIPVVDVHIEAQVMGGVRVTPEKMTFSQLKLGESVTQTLRISRASGDGFKVEKVTCPDKCFEFVVREVEPGRLFEVDAVFTPKPTTRWFQGQVCLWTNDPQQKVIFVNYSGNLRAQ